MDLENTFNLYGRTTIEFNCKPQRFLNIGDTAQTISTSGGTITNPTAFNAKPLITVYGSGAATLQVGEYVCTLARHRWQHNAGQRHRKRLQGRDQP